MGTFAKIIVASIVVGVAQQVVCSISDACRPAPKVEDPK